MALNLKNFGARLGALGLCVWLGGLSLPLAAHEHVIAQLQVTPFTPDTWARLMRTGPSPAAYVFTTTYCSVCPQVFDEIRHNARAVQPTPTLAVVMMDAQGDLASRHAHHFRGLNRLYAFDGFEPAIREAVDPGWPNITPYVVLVNRKGEVQRTLGAPSKELLRWWRR